MYGTDPEALVALTGPGDISQDAGHTLLIPFQEIKKLVGQSIPVDSLPSRLDSRAEALISCGNPCAVGIESVIRLRDAPFRFLDLGFQGIGFRLESGKTF